MLVPEKELDRSFKLAVMMASDEKWLERNSQRRDMTEKCNQVKARLEHFASRGDLAAQLLPEARRFVKDYRL